MFCIGIAGNIGSGKSEASKCFQQLGITVISADAISRELTAVNTPTLKKISHYFGQNVINPQGELNRTALRKLIFSDTNKRLWLEKLLHPLIKKTIYDRIQQSSSPYCVIEIPLLSNRQDYPYLNRILVITANQDIRIKRIMRRDNCDKNAAIAIIATQQTDEHLRFIADDVIVNDGSIKSLKKHISLLHNNYVSYSLQPE